MIRMNSGSGIDTTISQRFQYFCLIAVSVFFATGNFCTMARAQSAETFSNVFFQSEITEALQQVALQTGVNIVATENVTGLVSLSIQEKTAVDSVDSILSGTGYAYEEFDDYIFVYDPRLDTSVGLGVSAGEIFIPSNMPALTIFELLPDEFREFVTVTPESELLYIRAGKEMRDEILTLITQLDSVSRKSSRRIVLGNVSSDTVQDLIPDQLSPYVSFNADEEVVLVYGPEGRVEEIARLISEIDSKASEPFQRKDFKLTKIVLENLTSDAFLLALPPDLSRFATGAADTNTVIVYAPADITSDLTKIAGLVDEPAEQIQLIARVVALKQTSLMQLGNQLEYPQISAGAAFSDLPDSDFWEFRVGYSATRAFTNALNLRLSLLAENNDATIVASPQVTTQSGNPAEIKVTTAEYFQLAIERDGFFSADLEQIETGTILTVTPSVSRDGLIELSMDIEVSDVVARNEDDLPVVVSRRASTLVEVENGGTATIAGLIETRTSTANSGVPGMRRLPILGRGFSQDDFNHEVKQVAIFVTAKLREETDQSSKKIPAVNFKELDDSVFRTELETLLGKRD